MIRVKNIILGLCCVLILFIPINALATQGCCSWHGGVAYCGSSGYYICNDGTQSPSCTCFNNGGIELTDTSCDYSSYKSEINSLNDTITSLEEENKDFKSEADGWKSNFHTLLLFVIIYIIIKVIAFISNNKEKKQNNSTNDKYIDSNNNKINSDINNNNIINNVNEKETVINSNNINDNKCINNKETPKNNNAISIIKIIFYLGMIVLLTFALFSMIANIDSLNSFALIIFLIGIIIMLVYALIYEFNKLDFKDNEEKENNAYFIILIGIILIILAIAFVCSINK